MRKTLTWASALALMMSGSAFANPFEGMTAEQLFPGAENELERSTAYDALINSNLPDARDRFSGQTVTLGVLGGGSPRATGPRLCVPTRRRNS